MTTDDQAESNPTEAHTPGAKPPPAKKARKYRGLYQPEGDLPPASLVDEPRRAVTFKKLEMLQTAWDAWWAAAHGDDKKAYARARDGLYTLAVEYMPELITLAHNTLKARSG